MRLKLFLVLANILICTHGYAAELSIHSMVIGKKTLELVENRQVTFKADGDVLVCKISPNGHYVAYLRRINGATSVTIAKISGGSTKYTRALSAPTDPQSPQPSFWISDVRSMEWSPDSKLLVVEMLSLIPNPSAEAPVEGGVTDGIQNHYVLVLKSDCTLKTSIPLVSKNPQLDINGSAIQTLISPDSRSLIGLFDGEKSNRRYQWLQSIDISTGSERVICSLDKPVDEVFGWADDSSIICQRSIDTEDAHYHEILTINTSNGAEKNLFSKQNYLLSNNGKYALSMQNGIRVQNVETQQFIQVTKTQNASFVDWVTKNQMLLYSVEQSIKDESGKRTRAMRSLWLASIIERDNNAMCVALDYDRGPDPSVSSDCSRIAYISKGRLYIAELEWRDPTVDEKIAAGLKLTEEEEKQILLVNAKMIGVGVKSYQADFDDVYPSPASYQNGLKKYLDGENVFNRPGASSNIFKYLIPDGATEATIGDWATTPLGELDAGYSWKVVVYVDGHAKVVQK